ncbi:MAG TPA: HAD family phosphatase [Anaerolineae bacterium]|nr:HAD family phosphatase [Anaerolineae bacterium]
MPHFANVIFDLDGLMINTEPLHRRAFNAVLEVCNVDYQFSEQEYGELFTGISIVENAEYIRERFALPQTAESLAEGQRALFALLIGDAENLEPMSGLHELIRYLKEHDFRIAVASSSHDEHVQLALRGLNLFHEFDAVVGSDGIMKHKPAPDVYLRALSLLGATPSETIALEDSSSGVRAAKAAGVFVIAVPNEYTRGQDLTHSDLLVNDLYQVREFLHTNEMMNFQR